MSDAVGVVVMGKRNATKRNGGADGERASEPRPGVGCWGL
jgi:hypothetical protein